ncbi:MAG TPA: acyl-CoA dehydrogenase family protein [Syntrophales bacterium]|nr:acyl-CoA dehydrogenase family protein [Syntrophales bacterium]
MDFNLDDNQQMLVESVRRFVRSEILPGILERERKDAFPWDIIRKIWNMGIMNLTVPPSVGGSGVDVLTGALIIRELACGDAGIATSAMCNDLANAVIAFHGSPQQQERFLGPFVGAPLLASFCLTEPGAGSDNSAMSTFIRKEENGGYRLNGTKCFITNASHASQFTVFCKLEKPAGRFLSCVIVPLPEAPGEGDGGTPERREIDLPGGGRVTVGKPEDKLGIRLSNTASVTFEDVVVRADQVIGDRRLGFSYIVDVLDYARPMVAAIALGTARRALDLTLAYTRERKQFGSRICDLPVARETLVAMWKKTELAELALLKAAVKVQERASDRGLYASLAKNAAAEAALYCSAEGLHLHGGYGFTNEYEIAKLARDAHILDIYEGVREVQHMIMGREIV